MNSHVVSLELSDKLERAEYKQEGEFWWVKLKGGEHRLLSNL